MGGEEDEEVALGLRGAEREDETGSCGGDDEDVGIEDSANVAVEISSIAAGGGGGTSSSSSSSPSSPLPLAFSPLVELIGAAPTSSVNIAGARNEKPPLYVASPRHPSSSESDSPGGRGGGSGAGDAGEDVACEHPLVEVRFADIRFTGADTQC